ncbi:hypothetical protein PHMEG_0007704 [Phytophthora megakarya]|uniref:Uncharacterized protein n=1 Tax=Phytophthora megakarya TaxID=4795 RepID=A0A225WMN0_9STRA|nr:hypothetical protein PHMEG_0007704 [Phytophthora megakarya]
MNPATSTVDLGLKIKAGLSTISKREWLGAYRKARKQEAAYREQQPPPELVPNPSVLELQVLASEATSNPSNRLSEANDNSEFQEYEIAL